MSRTNHVPPENGPMAALSRKDCRHLLGNCELVDIKLAEVLCESGSQIRHVYFPTGSIVSLVVPVPGHTGLEVGLVGNEGVLGIPLMLGVKVWPLHAVVQGAGPAWRMRAAPFQGELAYSVTLKRWLNRYLYVSMQQFAQSAGFDGPGPGGRSMFATEQFRRSK